VLVTVKLGTCGRKSYGFGGIGRSAIVVLSFASGRSGPPLLLATLGSDARTGDRCALDQPIRPFRR
jgi:hypothetical protein